MEKISMSSIFSVENKLSGAKEPMERISMYSMYSVENKLSGA